MAKNSGDLLTCRGCGTPLAKKDGDTIRVLKPHNGRYVETLITVQFSGPGVLSIGCDKCAGLVTPHYFITLVADQPVPAAQ